MKDSPRKCRVDMPPKPRTHPPATRGYTLIELMVVLVIIMVFASVAAPRLVEQVRSAAVRKAARDFVSLARLARSRAVVEVRAFVLRVDGVERWMRVARRDGDRAALVVAARDLPPDLEVHFVSGTGAARSSLAIAFKPDGSAEEATVIFSQPDGAREAVEVNPVTARAEVVE